MEFAFTENGWQDFEYWMDQDQNIVDKIRVILKDISREPFKGLGKPEALKFDYKGCWSRRITSEHRLIYEISGRKGVDQKCLIHQCRFHYS